LIYPPAYGQQLADLLRQQDAYITASLWEPCGMHHIEGAQCGLPLIYHENGGGIVEFGKKYGISFNNENVVDAINLCKNSYSELKQKLHDNAPSSVVMLNEYGAVINQLLI